MIVIGDIGNTEIKIFIFKKNKVIYKKRFKTLDLTKEYIKKNFKFINKNKKQIKKIVFSSVVPKKYSIFKSYFQNKIKIKCIEIKSLNLKKILTIKVNKKQIGSDRLANAISVINQKSNFIVVDFGTATNFDVVIKNRYEGGIIAPGVKLSLNNLSSNASLIPKINLTKVKSVIGKNTNSAVKSGFFYGYSGLINNIIKLIFIQTGLKYKIILTGGFATMFRKSIKFNCIVKKDLTIQGILKIANNL